MPVVPALQNVILYVEDDDASAFLLENSFVETRFRMIRVSSADEALDFLSRCREGGPLACPRAYRGVRICDLASHSVFLCV